MRSFHRQWLRLWMAVRALKASSPPAETSGFPPLKKPTWICARLLVPASFRHQPFLNMGQQYLVTRDLIILFRLSSPLLFWPAFYFIHDRRNRGPLLPLKMSRFSGVYSNKKVSLRRKVRVNRDNAGEFCSLVIMWELITAFHLVPISLLTREIF